MEVFTGLLILIILVVLSLIVVDTLIDIHDRKQIQSSPEGLEPELP